MNIELLTDQINDMEFMVGLGDIRRVCNKVSGFSAPYVMKMLNMAVRNMGPDEYYLEIGTHRGRTLIGSMIGNDKDAVAVDDFSQFGDGDVVRSNLLASINEFNLEDRARFIEKESEAFLDEGGPHDIIGDRTAGVYFYDGNHDWDIALRNLQKGVPYLSDEAVIVLDDFSCPGVWRTVRSFMRLYPQETGILFSMKTTDPPFPHDMWWNGIVIISWMGGNTEA